MLLLKLCSKMLVVEATPLQTILYLPLLHGVPYLKFVWQLDYPVLKYSKCDIMQRFVEINIAKLINFTLI